MSNEKLAEALRHRIHNLRLQADISASNGDNVGSVTRRIVAEALERDLQAHAAEAAQAQAQSGEWVQKAIVDAKGDIEYVHVRIFNAMKARAEEAEAMFAAATQPQTERLAETLPSDDWFANEICEARNHWHEHHEANWLETDDNHPDDFMGKWLRSKLLAAHDTHPQPAQDAKDAAERLCRIYFEIAAEAVGEDEVRRRRDAAMAKESGR